MATCRRDFRNRPYPVKLKIRYYKGKLDLYYHGGVTEFDDYELCATVEVKRRTIGGSIFSKYSSRTIFSLKLFGRKFLVDKFCRKMVKKKYFVEISPELANDPEN